MPKDATVPSNALPTRVWIVGPVGAGKSTLADGIAARLGVEATHLDDLHWTPGWVARPKDELLRLLEPIVARPSFVVDGNYAEACGRFAACVDLFVWLDLPLATTFRRILVRSFQRSAFGIPCCNGNYESAWETLTGKESILAWSLSKHGGIRRRYTTRLAGRPHVRFQDPRRVADWPPERDEIASGLGVGRHRTTRFTSRLRTTISFTMVLPSR